jgi:hypothetical protein
MDRAAWPYGEKDEACGNGKRLAMPWRCRSALQPGKTFPCWSIINRTNKRTTEPLYTTDDCIAEDFFHRLQPRGLCRGSKSRVVVTLTGISAQACIQRHILLRKTKNRLKRENLIQPHIGNVERGQRR